MQKATHSQTKSAPKTAGKPTAELTVVRNDVEPKRPDFLTWTPEDTGYNLVMFKGADSEQDIKISRDEFMKLKCYLASLRGYPVPDPLTEEFLDSVDEPYRPA
jgi:hypothetical protein